MMFQHPLAYLVGVEGIALLRAWGGEYDEQFVTARLAEVRRMMEDEALVHHPGVHVESEATENAYRQWASSYDDPGNGLLELDLPFIDAALGNLPVGVAVDTACGTGRVARRLAARGHHVLGFDNSAAMLELARRNVPAVEFAVAAVDQLPLGDGSVDLVTNALAMTHVADLQPVLTEWARVLRPGGSAIISDVHPGLAFLGSVPKAEGTDGHPQQASCHPHTAADYLRAALATGFRVRAFDELPRDHSASATPLPEPVHEVGAWREWPWALLGWAPEASRAAWSIPSMLVWHLQLT
jgi:ubiquinone/menaquinone biosynthesis C-methylase UbiE